MRSKSLTQLESNVITLVQRNKPTAATKGAPGVTRLASADNVARGITDSVVTAQGLVDALNQDKTTRLGLAVGKAAATGLKNDADTVETMSDALLHTLVKKMVADPRCLRVLQAALNGP